MSAAEAYDLAYEEVVANACEIFLSDGKAAEKIAELKTRDKGLWKTIKDYITKLSNKIRAAYLGMTPDSYAGKRTAEMLDSVEELRKRWIEAVVDASEASGTVENTASENNTVKASEREIYSYEALISKAEMEVNILPKLSESEINKYKNDTTLFAKDMRQIAASANNPKNTPTKTYLYCKDLSGDVLITKDSFKHGAARMDAAYIAVCKNIATVLNNSIVVNELNPRESTDGGYVLLGMVETQDSYVIVRSIVNKRTWNLESYEELDAIKKKSIKKEDVGFKPPHYIRKNGFGTSSMISIANFLEFVNTQNLANSVLPLDVVKKLGSSRGFDENVTPNLKYSDRETDAEYLSAVERGDMETAQRMVDEAAKAAGYTDKLYHGTKQFGFTEFDPSHSDDKISIFVAGSEDLAQTYSGRYGKKQISDVADIDALSIDKVVERLSKESRDSYKGAELQTEYEVMNSDDIKNLFSSVDGDIERLQDIVEAKIKIYADKLATDFNDSNYKIHKRLVELNRMLEYYLYDEISTPLYMLINHTDVFADNSGVSDIEYKIRLRNKLSRANATDGVVIKKELGGYGVSIMSFESARQELKNMLAEGNYALYGNPKNQLVIDGKGQNWNDIRHWSNAVHYTKEGTVAERKGEFFRLYDKKTGNEIFHGRLAVNTYSEGLSADMRHLVMIDKANNVIDVRSEYMHTTREIARFAKESGYDSVKFENITDNGGLGESTGSGDVYACFDPNNLKSADPVTYDDSRNVIPLSERFNPENKDIRFSDREDIDNEESLGYTKQKNQKGENIYNENGNNAEVLEQGEVSTFNRGRDGLWKQGQDPEEVYKRLANSQNDKGGVRATRSGSSGWLGNRRGDKSYVLRLGTGLLRDLRGRQLSGVDTAGRNLSEDVNKKFADTVLKTNNGELLSLYHWTDARFTKFKKGDIGFHFGTLDTAYNRYKDIIDKRRTGESFYKESYVNIKNPAMINFDPMSWAVFPTAYKLNEQGIISNKDIAELEKLDGYTHTKYDSPASIELRRILTHKGYDGIIYSNGIEGDLSVIAFNDDQIYTVAENGIDIASRSNVSDETKLKYSERDSESFSDRSLLANALESVAQNDVERQKIAEYRANIANYEAQQKKLSELKRQIKEMSFAKGPRDKDAITNLRIEATKTENRINIYDKRLLDLEATKALKDVLEREKAKADLSKDLPFSH